MLSALFFQLEGLLASGLDKQDVRDYCFLAVFLPLDSDGFFWKQDVFANRSKFGLSPEILSGLDGKPFGSVVLRCARLVHDYLYLLLLHDENVPSPYIIHNRPSTSCFGSQ